MSRSCAVCAGVLLIVAGCSSSDFLLKQDRAGGRRQVTDGSVNAVTAVLQARLADAGISVVVQHEDGQVRLVGISQSNKAFRLVLRPDFSAGRKKTVVSVEEDAAGDETFCQLVRAALERPPQNTESVSR